MLSLGLDDFLIRKRNFLNGVGGLQLRSRSKVIRVGAEVRVKYYLSKETSSSVMLLRMDSCSASSVPDRGSEVLTGDSAD